jgi:hypothetical protein
VQSPALGFFPEGDRFSAGLKASETEGPVMARLRRLRAMMQ